MTTSPLIALISATPSAIKPAEQAIEAELPHARVWNLLDDRLLVDAQERGGVDQELWQRMELLIRYALDAGAEGILLTCSQYGAVAREVATSNPAVPILAPDDAAFAAVSEGRFARVLVLASVESSLVDTTERLRAALKDPSATELVGLVVPGASVAASRADAPALTELLVSAVRKSEQIDAVLLAQYSLSIAQTALATEVGLPVFAGPSLAASVLASGLRSQ